MRFVRSHAGELGINPEKLLAGGGSSGGVMAASLAYGKGPDYPEDDKNVSVKPAGLVLFNPAIVQFNNTDLITGNAEEKLKIDRMISPMSNLDGKGPPMIVFFGTKDWLLRREREFCQKALSFGTRCELYTAEGQPHGFFNAPPWLAAVTFQTDRFLMSLGYLTGKPTIQVHAEAVLVKVLP
jgi:acetyl esterase/lipase